MVGSLMQATDDVAVWLVSTIPVAVIVAVPSPAKVTRPVVETVQTAVLLEDQVT
jgi:hypothetical protein